MNVYVIDDFGYKTWIVANNAREAVNFYQKEVIGENVGLTVSDVSKLTPDEIVNQSVTITDDESEINQVKTFTELLQENQSDKPWVIASEE